MVVVKITTKESGLASPLQLILCLVFFLIVQFSNAQDKSAGLVYKDETYKYQFAYPGNYVFKIISKDLVQFRDKKDIESNTRISVNIINFETTTSSGKFYDFGQFVQTHSKKLYTKNYSGTIDSLIIKDFSNSKNFKGKEVYVRIVNKSEQSATGKEEQIIKGPVFIFDISAKIGIPGIALVIYQVTDDSKTTRVLRSIVEDLKLEN